MKPSQYSYLPIIGLEIHVEPKTKSKMFCGCDAHHFQVKPNTHTCPVCLGLPGALPVPNQTAIEACVKLGLALGCSINKFSKFDRKNYFYPDLPKGYQISQYDVPFCYQGKFEFAIHDAKELAQQKELATKTVGITRVHMEEDTGKLVHATVKGKKVTLVDFNRSGVPLIEIVTDPDLRSAADAKRFLKWLSRTIQFLDISDCDMEKGSMRLEANVSVKKFKNPNEILKNENLPKYKVELKNINSFRFLEKAVEYEIERQTELLKEGNTPIQETRGYNENKGVTFSQRTKEEAQDYRYFPEPDIPPVEFKQREIDGLKSQIPELPLEAAERLIKKHQIRPDYAELLCSERQTLSKFEQLLKLLPQDISANDAAKQIINQKVNLVKLNPEEILKKINQARAKFTIDEKELARIINQVLHENLQAVVDYQAGKTNVVGFLIGQVAKATKGQADPQLVKRLLESKLTSP